jgi:hypothetical protein
MRTSVLKFIGFWMLLFLIAVLTLLYLAATVAPDQAIATGTAAAAKLTEAERAARQPYDLPVTLLLVAFAGALGGFVSLQRRIQMIPTEGDPLVSIFELQNGVFSVYLAPLLGATFALVLFFIFLGGYLRGELFPDFTLPSLILGNFAWSGTRMSGGDFAKLLIWSFIAGFAERFVPDTLTRLVDRGREASTSSNLPVAPAPPFPAPASPPVTSRPRHSPPFQ